MNRRHKKHIDLIGKKHYTEPCYPCVRDGGIRLIYLDYTANTPADPAVLEAFCRAEQAFIGNANSAHGEGRRARAVFAVSRDRKNALCSWRISLSHLTTDAEIDEFLNVFDDCYREGFR